MGGGAREFVVLGTSAQAPTRQRAHNGYLLRWDDDAIIFDPGEGTQRQLLGGDIPTGGVSAIAITHFHGDHCLGLPGVLGRLRLDRRHEPVDVYFPESGAVYVDRLCTSAMDAALPELRLHPLPPTPTSVDRGGHTLHAVPLDHSVDTLGYRIEAPSTTHVDAEELAGMGVTGPAVGRLLTEGFLDVDGRRLLASDHLREEAGQAVAFVMDTTVCDGALALAEQVDLLLCESTFLASERSLAHQAKHLTAGETGQIAARAGAGRLLLSHFSARHPDAGAFAAEASRFHPDVVAATDLAIVRVPAS